MQVCPRRGNVLTWSQTFHAASVCTRSCSADLAGVLQDQLQPKKTSKIEAKHENFESNILLLENR